MREYILTHPHVVGLVLAGLSAWATWNAFQAGRAAGLLGESARVASEALGG